MQKVKTYLLTGQQQHTTFIEKWKRLLSTFETFYNKLRYTTLFKTKHEKALQNLLAVDVDVLNLELEGVEEDFPGK